MNADTGQDGATAAKRSWPLTWYQFRLRTLMLLMLAASLLMSAWAFMRRYVAEDRAVAAIAALGGEMRCSLQRDVFGNELPDPAPSEPQWLRNLLGNSFFHSVGFAELTSDEQLQHVGALTQLRSLRTWPRPVVRNGGSIVYFPVRSDATDAGLKNLRSLTHLRELDLCHFSITDETLSILQDLKQLEELALSGRNITDSQIKCLCSLQQLSSLKLISTNITDEGVKEIRRLPDLKELWIANAPITDASLETICDLTQLEKLVVSYVRPTNAGLRHLRAMRRLRLLAISEVDDSAMQHIQSLNDLETLSLRGDISDASLSRLPALRKLKCLHLYPATWEAEDGEAEPCETKDFVRLHLSDAGMSYIGQLAGLKFLLIEDSEITDDGLRHLETLSHLEHVVLHGTAVTHVGVGKLQKAVPGLAVCWAGSHTSGPPIAIDTGEPPEMTAAPQLEK